MNGPTQVLESGRNLHESDVAERFLERADDDSFSAVFRMFSPQLVAFFRRRGHETGVAEDLAQEVMLTVYRKAGQLRDRKLFRAWLFQVARNAACRHFAQRARDVPTVNMAEIGEFLPAANYGPLGPTAEFKEWMKFLDATERETMMLRFVEEWEYHEIAAAQAIPISTVQWRVFNSKKKIGGAFEPDPRCEIESGVSRRFYNEKTRPSHKNGAQTGGHRHDVPINGTFAVSHTQGQRKWLARFPFRH